MPRKAASGWPDLKETIVAVDGTRSSLPDGFEGQVIARHPGLPLRFLFYSRRQAHIAEKLKLPYVFSWLSWSLCIANATTTHALIHDYDALVLGDGLRRRYEIFRASRAKVQGVSWYDGNGVSPDDRLATTFEAFVDVPWLRTFAPIDMFNQIRFRKGRSVDYDTLLDIQENHLSADARAIVPMGADELVHPSQMIHQYTMFRKSPGAELPCFAVIMIPVFMFLGGDRDALNRASRRLFEEGNRAVRLLGDDAVFNLRKLTVRNVDWTLKQAVTAFIGLRVGLEPSLIRYGTNLYKAVGASADEIWRGDFLPGQGDWIRATRELIPD